MSDVECSFTVQDWFSLFTTEWYYDNTLEVYLDGENVLYVHTVDLCENWVEYFIHDMDGIRLMESGEAICERSYGEVTLKIRRT